MNEQFESNTNDIVLKVEGVTKRFPGVLANDNVNLSLRRGEILALLGENGAGKSTLMNIIYGLYHQDEGTIHLKGKEVRFTSPREAIHSGIGMVHQHFQLVNVMTVAENVMLGEEDTVARTGKGNPLLELLLKWLPSVVMFLLVAGVALSLNNTTYAVVGVIIAVAASALVSLPEVARIIWGFAWRAGLALIALNLAGQVELITRVGFTAVALRQQVTELDEKKPQEMDDGFTVKRASVETERINFQWSKEYRDADEAGTGINGVIASAKETLEEYRDRGVPGWMIDAIDDAPPVANGIGLVFFLWLLGWHSITSWRGMAILPRRLERYDLVLMGVLALVYVGAAWTNLHVVSTGAQVVLFVLLIAGLGFEFWQTVQRRGPQADETVIGSASPVDGVIDSLLVLLSTVTEVGNTRAAAERVRELSQRYGLEVDPDAVIEKLPVGAQQRVEIIKALYRQADILILDEPTAVLTPQEGKELFKIMRELASQGVTIIFITHKLKEVFEVATNIVVMRGGAVVGTTTPDQATETSLAAMMVGREVILQVEKDEAKPAEPILEVSGLSARDNRGAVALDEVGFTVRAGEVLGIAGVQGNGQTELVEVLTGLREATGGSVKILGTELQPDEQPDAGFWDRVSALVVDTLITALLAYLVGFFVWYFRDGTLGTMGIILTLLGVDATWHLGSWLATGHTLGMTFFGLQVTDPDAHRANPVKLVQRYVIFLLLRVPLFVPLIASWWPIREAGTGKTWFDTLLNVRLINRARITPRSIKDIGTSHVPENRHLHGLVKPYSVADNLVLNDYYERPYAKEPNTAELPGTLLRYLGVVGVIVAILTVLAVYLWDDVLWTALLDAYHVPEPLRDPANNTGAAKAAVERPHLIGTWLLLISELLFVVIGHIVASWLLGTAAVQRMVDQAWDAMQGVFWNILGRDGEPPPPTGGLLRDDAAIKAHARSLIEQFDIRTPSPDVDGGNLSGGNQQKLVVAREFSRKPRLLIAAQPTRGIDVGSIEFIHNQIIEQRDAGAAVLLVSAELDEIMALSDRIAVLYKGQVIDSMPAETATREQLGLLMAGIKNASAAAPAGD